MQLDAVKLQPSGEPDHRYKLRSSDPMAPECAAADENGFVRTTRRSSKVLLVDEEHRVLLFCGVDRTKPDISPWWFAVGGGIERGETPQAAAIRETYEETGLTIGDPGPVVFTRRFAWDFEGEEYDQEEWFFLVGTANFEPSSAGWTETESATIRGHRWWSIDELRATDEAFFPEDLADQLERLFLN